MTNDQTTTKDDRESAIETDRGTFDGLVAEQLHAFTRFNPLQPEARLALAVLEDAALTLRSAYGVETLRAQRLAAQVWTWLESNDAHHAFTFRMICQHLDLDAEWLRRGLARWRPSLSPNAIRADSAARKRRRAA